MSGRRAIIASMRGRRGGGVYQGNSSTAAGSQGTAMREQNLLTGHAELVNILRDLLEGRDLDEDAQDAVD